VGKICNFWPISRCISVTARDRASGLVTSNRTYSTPATNARGRADSYTVSWTASWIIAVWPAWKELRCALYSIPK